MSSRGIENYGSEDISWPAGGEHPSGVAKGERVEVTPPEAREISEAEAEAIRKAWREEHEQQLADQRMREVAAAGEPTNIGEDGLPHFARMVQTAENPPAWSELCGSCETAWPCEVYSAEHMADAGPTVNAGAEPAGE